MEHPDNAAKGVGLVQQAFEKLDGGLLVRCNLGNTTAAGQSVVGGVDLPEDELLDRHPPPKGIVTYLGSHSHQLKLEHCLPQDLLLLLLIDVCLLLLCQR